MRRVSVWILGSLISSSVWAETPQAIQQHYAEQVPAFSAWSASAGEKFYAAQGPKGLACSSCHTADPRNAGKHEKTAKPIEPLAPSANAQRFSDLAKVEKWFTRNCQDVLGRACTAQEKGDLMAFVLSR